MLARDLYESLSGAEGGEMVTGPTFEELLELASLYVDERVRAMGASIKEDIGIYHWDVYKGDCLPMERFDAGTLDGEPVSFLRTVHGPVVGYATVNGERVAISEKRRQGEEGKSTPSRPGR